MTEMHAAGAVIGLFVLLAAGAVTVRIVRQRRIYRDFKVRSEESDRISLEQAAELLKTRVVEISGNVKKGNLPDVIQYLETARKTGVLEIMSGRRKGSMNFFRGEIHDASFRKNQGRLAALELMAVQEADYTFVACSVPRENKVGVSTQDLLLEYFNSREAPF